MTNFSVFTLLGGLPGAVRGRGVTSALQARGHGPASPFIVKNLLTRGFWRDIIDKL